MVMVENDEDSGPPSAAGRESRSTMSPLSHYPYDIMLPLSSIIHVHYRHLLIILHVYDCFTTSFTIGFCRYSRSIHRISSSTVYYSVHSPSLRVLTLGRNDRLPLIPFSPFHHTSDLTRNFFLVLSPSRCSLPPATAR